MLFISQESNIEKLLGVATLPLPITASGTLAIYFINRPPTPNILGGSVCTAIIQECSLPSIKEGPNNLRLPLGTNCLNFLLFSYLTRAL